MVTYNTTDMNTLRNSAIRRVVGNQDSNNFNTADKINKKLNSNVEDEDSEQNNMERNLNTKIMTNGKYVEERRMQSVNAVKKFHYNRMLKTKLLPRRLGSKKSNKVKTNGQCSCKKKKKTAKDKLKEQYQDRSELLNVRLGMSWENCEFQKKKDTPCKRSSKFITSLIHNRNKLL